VPWQRPGALAPWLAAADALLIPPSHAPLEKFGTCVLPMKLLTYLAAERPILAPEAPDTAELLEHEKTALLVAPGDPSAAAAALDRIFDDSKLAETLAANGRQLASDLTWDRRAERLAIFLRRRLGAARRPLETVSALGI
jgi:glycosyltransferase involved in cell wall biosynthesis